jgi:hypothetical protein
MDERARYLQKHYAGQRAKNFRQALAHRIAEEFPRIGGPRIQLACADVIVEVIERHYRPLEFVRHGQLVWLAISVDDPPARNKSIAQTRLVPVLLELSAPEDVEAILADKPSAERLADRCVRICRQAYEQGGLLSNSDLALILHVNDARIAQQLSLWEDAHGQLVPRRTTVHDVGSGLTHKRLICLKRFREGKPSEMIARETYHSIEAVDRYLGQYDRARSCRLEGFDLAKTAFTMACSPGLVRQYWAIDDELEGRRKGEKRRGK